MSFWVASWLLDLQIYAFFLLQIAACERLLLVFIFLIVVKEPPLRMRVGKGATTTYACREGGRLECQSLDCRSYISVVHFLV